MGSRFPAEDATQRLPRWTECRRVTFLIDARFTKRLATTGENGAPVFIVPIDAQLTPCASSRVVVGVDDALERTGKSSTRIGGRRHFFGRTSRPAVTRGAERVGCRRRRGKIKHSDNQSNLVWRRCRSLPTSASSVANNETSPRNGTEQVGGILHHFCLMYY